MKVYEILERLAELEQESLDLKLKQNSILARLGVLRSALAKATDQEVSESFIKGYRMLISSPDSILGDKKGG
jgi:hypothetical protein